LTSCQNEKKLNGTWISAYEYDERDSLKEPTTGIPFNEILAFNDGTLKIKEFKYDWYEKERSFKFKLKGDKLVIEDNEADFADIIDPMTNDSIVINSLSSPLTRVYKKLADSLKSESVNFKLKGKKFIRNYKKWTDTIQFINDSVYVSNSWKLGNSELNWERVNYNGFDILFTDIYPPFIIKKKRGNDIYLSSFDKEKEDYILKEID
jgi:hypothetical protein